MSPEEYLANFCRSLGESETVELGNRFVAQDIPPPPFLEGEFGPNQVGIWVRENFRSIVPTLLSVVDPEDEAIAYLYRFGLLDPTPEWNKRQFWRHRLEKKNACGIRFRLRSGAYSLIGEAHFPDFETSTGNVFHLTDLAASSAALYELYIATHDANLPLGLLYDEPAPLVQVQGGSVRYSLGGGLFATGVTLIVACGEGLIASQVTGFGGGAALASVGLLDLVSTWRRQGAETRKFKAETKKIEAETLTIEAERQKLLVTSRKGESDRPFDGVYGYERPAYSSLVPSEVVRTESNRLGLTESYGRHLLNRTLSTLSALQAYFTSIEVEDKDKES